MKISIGIVAYNESRVIGKMLHTLLEQSLFHQDSDQGHVIEIIVVPNGCTDDTASVAKKTLEDLINSIPNNNNLSWQVSELEQPGKSNAWNVYVHSLSAKDAQYLFLADSDIELLDSKTLESMISVLEDRPEVWISVDKPIKDVILKKNKNIMEMLSANVGSLSGNKTLEGGAAWICGQLYCGRAEVLRQIWLPTILPCQDSFLYDMITTEGLTVQMNPERIVLAPSASHVFESYVNISKLLRHEKWLIISSTINKLLYQKLPSHGTNFQDIGLLIKTRNDDNPQWINSLVQEAIQDQGWWLIDRHILVRRFQSLLSKSWPQLLLLFPLASLAFIVDLTLSIQANLELHQGKVTGYWGK